MEQGVQHRLVLELDAVEEAFGFGLAEERGVRAVTCELRPGLRAVKVHGDDGAAEYAICTDDLRPVYPSAKSLDELRVRFPGSQRLT